MDSVNLIDMSGGVVKLPHALSNVTDCLTDKGEHYITGNIKNMYVKIRGEACYVSGSLNKFLNGNSLVNMTRQDTQFAIEKLEDELELILGNFKVTKLEFGNCIEVENAPIDYIRLMDHVPRHKKFIMPNSVYFKIGSKKLSFYDKIKEMKEKNQPIPIQFEGKNMIKAEVERTRLSKQFNKVVMATDLYQKDFFLMLENDWKNQLIGIKTMGSSKPTTLKMTSSQYKDYVIAQFVELMGVEAIIQSIDQDRSFFSSPKEVQRMKSAIRNSKQLVQNNPLVIELTEKIMGFGVHV